MKKSIRFIALLLVVVMLAGCGSSDKTYTCGELTMTVPSYMKDVSSQSDFSAYTFALDSTKVAIFGLQETYAAYSFLDGYSLEDYADAVIQVNGLDAYAASRSNHDYLYFSYSSDTDQGTYKYLAGVYQTEEGFWLIQLAAPVAQYDETAFFAYLDSVSFD